jgi:hypothetical protein
MSHLTIEALARIVDEPATGSEQAHLDACPTCRSTLDELRMQTTALAALPVFAPPADAWESIGHRMHEADLRAERQRRTLGIAARIAAAITIFALGAATQFVLSSRGGSSTQATAEAGNPGAANQAGAPTPLISAAPASVEEATARLRIAETFYTRALLDFAALTSPEPPRDAVARLATLEAIVLTTRAALERAPADPLINTYHLAAQAERETLLEQLRRRPEAGQWY